MNNLAPLLFVALGAGFFFWMFWRARPDIKPEELRTSLKAGTAVLIDVREPSEWTSGTAKQAALLPLSDLRGSRKQWQAFLDQHPDKQLFLYCQSGSRSSLAAAQLRREGRNARNAGSLAAIDQAGWPLCRKRL